MNLPRWDENDNRDMTSETKKKKVSAEAKKVTKSPKKAVTASAAPHTHNIHNALEQYFGFREFKGTQDQLSTACWMAKTHL